MKLLREVYKTYEGARKRAGFENGIAASEHAHGYKARLYRYSIVAEGGHWRVKRVKRVTAIKAKRKEPEQ